MPRLFSTNAPVSSTPIANSQMETEFSRGGEIGCFIARTTSAVSADDVSRIIQTVEAKPTRGTTRLPSSQKSTPNPTADIIAAPIPLAGFFFDVGCDVGATLSDSASPRTT